MFSKQAEKFRDEVTPQSNEVLTHLIEAKIRFPEYANLEIAITQAFPKYSHAPFIFNPQQNAYSIYIGTEGTVTFNNDVVLHFTDMETYAVTTRNVKADTVYSIAELSGGVLYFNDDSGDFAAFMLDYDPIYAQGVEAATLDIKQLFTRSEQ
jgi:hypothetical protein